VTSVQRPEGTPEKGRGGTSTKDGKKEGTLISTGRLLEFLVSKRLFWYRKGVGKEGLKENGAERVSTQRKGRNLGFLETEVEMGIYG